MSNGDNNKRKDILWVVCTVVAIFLMMRFAAVYKAINVNHAQVNFLQFLSLMFFGKL